LPTFEDAADFDTWLGSITQPSKIIRDVCEDRVMPLALRAFQNFWLGDIPGETYAPFVLAQKLPSGRCLTVGSSR